MKGGDLNLFNHEVIVLGMEAIFMGVFIAGSLTLWVIVKILKGKKK